MTNFVVFFFKNKRVPYSKTRPDTWDSVSIHAQQILVNKFDSKPCDNTLGIKLPFLNLLEQMNDSHQQESCNRCRWHGSLEGAKPQREQWLTPLLPRKKTLSQPVVYAKTALQDKREHSVPKMVLVIDQE